MRLDLHRRQQERDTALVRHGFVRQPRQGTQALSEDQGRELLIQKQRALLQKRPGLPSVRITSSGTEVLLEPLSWSND
jgi:hypothetical protein